VQYTQRLHRAIKNILQRPRLYQVLAVGIAICWLYLFGELRTRGVQASSPWLRVGIDLLSLGFFGGLVYFFAGRFAHLTRERDALETELQAAQGQIRDASQRQKTLSTITQMFAEARDEAEVIELVLQLSIESIGAKSASLVPLDERGQPLHALTAGEIPIPALDAWLEYLASPEVRQRCSTCDQKGKMTLSCPLLKGTFLDAVGLFCLPIKRGDREYGVLNLYVPRGEELDPEAQKFLRTVIDETGFALERVRLRRRELATIRQLQAVREKSDLKGLLLDLMNNLRDTLEADFTLLQVQETEGKASHLGSTYGEVPESSRPLIDGVIQSVISTGNPVLLGDVGGDAASDQEIRSLLVVPLLADGHAAIGTLVVANRRARAFSKRKMSMAQTVAGQVALVVQNVNAAAELEYKTIVQERTRLAREIHDGLAQTLGFLKLKMAQMRSYLDQGEHDKLSQTMTVCYQSLSEAYQDARQAIDGLRVSQNELGLKEWLVHTVIDFENNTGVQVEICEPFQEVELAPEVHAQLIRIVQEALSNVRKHSGGKGVEISSRRVHGDLILEIRDDGIGFQPEDVTVISQYGLKGMRERAELIGADFQVISRPGAGTTIRVRLPIRVEEGML
jgi:two-component system nitrate/nitrite sensor histidine kinase NarX